MCKRVIILESYDSQKGLEGSVGLLLSKEHPRYVEHPAFPGNPCILVEDQLIYGCECWWTPVPDKGEITQEWMNANRDKVQKSKALAAIVFEALGLK